MVHTLEEHIKRITSGEKLGPYNIFLGVTTRCNLNCVMCGRKMVEDAYATLPEEFLKPLLSAMGIQPTSEMLEVVKEGVREGRLNKSVLRAHTPREAMLRASKAVSSPGDNAAMAAASVIRFLREWFMYELSYEEMARVVRDGVKMGAGALSLAGIGEPFLRWPDIRKLMVYAKSNGLMGSVTTNATAITDEMARELVEMKWDLITVSLDGPNASVNDRLRGKGAFDRALQGIERVQEAKRISGSDLPEIDINTVITSENISSLPEMVEFAHEIGARSVNFNPLMIHEPRHAVLDAGVVEGAYSYLEEAASLAEEHGINTNASVIATARMPLSIWMYLEKDRKDWSRLIDEGIMKEYGKVPYTYPSRKDLPGLRCLEPWLSVVIDTNGGVKPCCLPYMAYANLSIRNMPLKEAWFSPELNTLRHDMLTKGMPGECSGVCHPIMLQPTEGLKASMLARRGLIGRILGFFGGN